MKKIATIASAVALTATSLSASAWWGCNPCAMTEEQQQAMAQQQTKAREQMMAAQRWMAEQMAAQRAEMTKRMQAQGVDPMTMGFPGTMGPEGTHGSRRDQGPVVGYCRSLGRHGDARISNHASNARTAKHARNTRVLLDGDAATAGPDLYAGPVCGIGGPSLQDHARVQDPS